ncbi:AAA-type ATPase lid domain-containing protein [Herbiconiux ginsengi]|uniref:Regulatory protein, Fis family n=1 Tax=Herbiconiux ginsengi TaxID=381665 RepID=A0A1H3JGN5_9MICO|nr:GAF domain-containing protein [Herbiconiux ginsengi]SDY39086.1 regulatory protein, Fis family [Herbiconiux ginsengi]
MDAHDLPSRAQVRGAPVAAIPARVLASWQRSEDYGVSLDAPQPVFSGTYDDQSLFYECGREVLAELHSTLASEPVGLMLTDADGLVLNRLSGDHELLHALDRVHLAPGFSYSEREAGTNGLGLALADRVPSLVRANDHYSLSLCGYTCAAAPIFDPVTGRLEGAVNFTTWSDARSELLLALAQTAATSTANLMLARSHGHRPRRVARGQVFRIQPLRQEAGSGSLDELSESWNGGVAHAAEALRGGRLVAAVGERGSGRSTLLAQAERRVSPGDRLLVVRAPDPHDVDSWLAFWTPELARPHTGFVICDTDELPATAAERLHGLLVGPRDPAAGAIALSAERLDAIPSPLAALVDTVVQVPPLRERAVDILPLADHLARRARGRGVDFTPAAARALTDYAWPGNVAELAEVVKEAALRSDVIDTRHLPPELLARAEHLPRIKAFERDEMIRVLSRQGVSIEDAAAELGMSRATIYRKLAQYGIRLPKARPHDPAHSGRAR